MLVGPSTTCQPYGSSGWVKVTVVNKIQLYKMSKVCHFFTLLSFLTIFICLWMFSQYGSIRHLNAVKADLAPSKAFDSPLPIPTLFETRKELFELSNLPHLPTIVSQSRRILTAELAYRVLHDAIPGDFVETGVFSGGTTILMYKVLERFESLFKTRKLKTVVACDSFDGMQLGLQFFTFYYQYIIGLPAPSALNSNKPHISTGTFKAGMDRVLENLRVFNVNTTRIKLVPGWFNESLSRANIGPISFLRLDGDFYESTRDALTALYAQVSIGGLVYVDDYYAFDGCKRAVDEFRSLNGISSPLVDQYLPENYERGEWKAIEAVWWVKT